MMRKTFSIKKNAAVNIVPVQNGVFILHDSYYKGSSIVTV